MNSPGQIAQGAAQILERTRNVLAKDTVRISFSPTRHPEHHQHDYFPADFQSDLDALQKGPIKISLDLDPGASDIVIATGHGDAMHQRLWQMRRNNPDLLVWLWLWDNHLPLLPNLHAAQAAHFFYCSHGFAMPPLINPFSISMGHVPAAASQWSRTTAKALFTGSELGRGDGLYAGYVLYPGSARTPFLQALKEAMPGPGILLMQPSDRSRYFTQTKEEAFREWLRYKTSLVLPLKKDLSTRFFDGLLAGHVPIVPRDIEDFDLVIPPDVQKLLPIIRLDTVSVNSVREAHAQAVEAYDAGGLEGAQKRHQFVREGHHLVNRIALMIRRAQDAASRTLPVGLIQQKDVFGLSVVQNPAKK